MMPFEVLLYYLYTPISDPEAWAAEHRGLCETLGLRGRILIGAEGINGTVSGLVAATTAYREAVTALPETQDIVFKIDPVEDHVFPRLSIKVRDEIVTLGLPGEEDVDPTHVTGTYLSPTEFFEKMQNPDAIVLDGRNKYESDLGRFRGAVCPKVENFRDFPQWIRENLTDARDRPILTYCTGGIRCEKLSGFLVKEGFKNVYQLEGGIVTYGRDDQIQGRDFEGSCYVFDQRIKVDVNQANPEVISRCKFCGERCDRYINCSYPNCNRQHFCCPDCEESNGHYCDLACRQQHESSGNHSQERVKEVS